MKCIISNLFMGHLVSRARPNSFKTKTKTFKLHFREVFILRTKCRDFQAKQPNLEKLSPVGD